MGSRIAATAVLLAGAVLLAWVAFGGNAAETVSSPLSTNAPADSEAATNAETADDGARDNSAADDRAADDAAGDDRAADDSGDSDTADDSADETDTAEGESAPDPEPTATPEPSIDEPENYGPRMDLVELDGWLQTTATSIDEFNGQVVLVEMWTFGCHNCKARIPYNQSYVEEFADENFQIIGVHAPEFSYEADVANIENALVDLGVTWPIALDTNKLNFRAWQPGTTNYWPRTYVIDQNGDIRYDHIGEGKYEELRETIRFLVENPPEPKTAASS